MAAPGGRRSLLRRLLGASRAALTGTLARHSISTRVRASQDATAGAARADGGYGEAAIPGSKARAPAVAIAAPPAVSGGSPNRGPDANGWYNHPVSINFNGTDATSGVASCSGPSYGGPDTAGASFTGTCTDQAGNTSAPASFGPIKYDATPPSVSASLSRGPDFGDWYKHPVDFGASGSDNLSGIASCSGGTLGGGGSGTASCTDNAGNSASAGVGVK